MSLEYILVKSKNSEILENSACGGAVSSIFQYLLDNKIVDGVLTLTHDEDVYDGVPEIITDSTDIIKTCGSLHCAPTMVGDIISEYLPYNKLAVAVKPCDMRAIDELEKRHRINPDNLIKIGLNCGGTVNPLTARKMIDLYYDVDPNDVVKEEIDKGKFIIDLKDGSHKAVKIDDLEDEGYGRRQNCQRCEVKIPRNADIACGNWGSDEGWTFVEINSKKGHDLINDGKNRGYIETKPPLEKQIEIRDKVENIMIKMGNKFQKKMFEDNYPSVEEWNNMWKRCIKCYACRDICPVCWCNECELEKDYFNKKDSIFPDPLTFQGVRLAHMGFSCCNCGQCEDVCPMEIPVSKIFYKSQIKYRNSTDYFSGISNEKPPLYSPEKEQF